MNKSRSEKHWTYLFFMLFGSFILTSNFSVVLAETTGAPSVDTDAALYKEISKVVLEYYQKADVSVNDKGVKFKFKTKKEMGFYSNQPVEVPSDGGILGDVSVVPGEFKGKQKNMLPFEERCGFYTQLLMAPFSSKRHAHLLAHLSFPEDASIEFREKFKDVVNSFNAGEEPVKPEPQALSTKPISTNTVDLTSSELGDDTTEGPLKDQRQALLQKLKEARQSGVGISAYATEFNRIEKSVKDGTDEAAISKKLNSLSGQLSEQMDARAASSSSQTESAGMPGDPLDTPKRDGTTVVKEEFKSAPSAPSGPPITSQTDWSKLGKVKSSKFPFPSLNVTLYKVPNLPSVPSYPGKATYQEATFEKIFAHEGFPDILTYKINFHTIDSRETVNKFYGQTLPGYGWDVHMPGPEFDTICAYKGSKPKISLDITVGPPKLDGFRAWVAIKYHSSW